MITAIFQFLKELFKAIGGFQKTADRKLTEPLIMVKSELRIDRLKDRDLRHEAKILIGYQIKPVELPPKTLYAGTKDEILTQIKQDLARILTPNQERKFRKTVRRDKVFTYYTIAIHPLTQHE